MTNTTEYKLVVVKISRKMFENPVSDSDISISRTPRKIKSAANFVVSNLKPKKSKRQYEKC